MFIAKPFKPKFIISKQIEAYLAYIEKFKSETLDFDEENDLHATYLYKKTEQEIFAYQEARKELEIRKLEPLSEALIQLTNAIVLNGTTQRLSTYRTKDCEIKNSKQEAIFHAPLAYQGWVPYSMKNLVQWVNNNISSGDLAIPVIAAIFHYKFLKIHPFFERLDRDGNGRTVRLATSFILIKGGYNPKICRNLEKYFEENKDGYYKALDFRKNGETKEYYDWDDQIDVSSWLEYFCVSFHQCFTK